MAEMRLLINIKWKDVKSLQGGEVCWLALSKNAQESLQRNSLRVLQT